MSFIYYDQIVVSYHRCISFDSNTYFYMYIQQKDAIHSVNIADALLLIVCIFLHLSILRKCINIWLSLKIVCYNCYLFSMQVISSVITDILYCAVTSSYF